MTKVGIIGLSGSGKSSLFSALTKTEYKQYSDTNNTGIVKLNDKRLEYLRDLFVPVKYTPATFEFVDLKGTGSSEKGSMNQSLSVVREVDCLAIVLKGFEDNCSPIVELDNILFELVFSDLEQIKRRVEKLEKKIKAKDKEAIIENELLCKIIPVLENGAVFDYQTLSKAENDILINYNLLTFKKFFIVYNINEERLLDIKNDKTYLELLDKAKQLHSDVIAISAKIELELSGASEEDIAFFKDMYQIDSLSTDLIIRTAFKLLGLKTYFTCGKDEVRAWIFKDGMKAPECARIIHTDFERGFIKAETLAFSDLIEYKTFQAAKSAGRYRLEGKEYLVKDGDILLFRFNV